MPHKQIKYNVLYTTFSLITLKLKYDGSLIEAYKVPYYITVRYKMHTRRACALFTASMTRVSL